MKNIRIIALLLIAVLTVSALFSCTEKPADSTAAQTEAITTEAETTKPETTEAETTEAETTEAVTDEEPAVEEKVFVTIYDGQSVVLNRAAILKSDENADEKWTVLDALSAAHKDNEADKSFEAGESQWGGLMITKLWGIENGGSYGFCLNNVFANGLMDEIKDGDEIYAYVYTDTATFGDVFSFFDKAELNEAAGAKVTLTLSVLGWDENYACVSSPLEGATITLNGETTEFVTGADGTVEITLPAESATISAVKDGMILVPAVCVFTPVSE